MNQPEVQPTNQPVNNASSPEVGHKKFRNKSGARLEKQKKSYNLEQKKKKSQDNDR